MAKGRKKAAVTHKVKKVEASDVCFVIMPFGEWFDDYYSDIYKPAIEKAGLTAHRADDLYRPSTITNDIWVFTQKAKVILADLSGKNPGIVPLTNKNQYLVATAT